MTYAAFPVEHRRHFLPLWPRLKGDKEWKRIAVIDGRFTALPYGCLEIHRTFLSLEIVLKYHIEDSGPRQQGTFEDVKTIIQDFKGNTIIPSPSTE